MSEEKLKELEEKRDEIIRRVNELSSRLTTRLEKRDEIYKLRGEAKKLWKQIIHLKRAMVKET